MIYYERIDVSEEIHVNKTNESKECDFLNKGFKFQTHVYNGFHDLLMMSTNLVDIAILNINGVDYPYNINRISKSEPVNLLQNSDLTKKT